MKAMILAGGFGTRISEESDIRPKPMVEVGNMPILWHIMKIYSAHGINDFVICCGYKGRYIREWFNTYHLQNADVTFDLENGSTTYHKDQTEPWRVTLVDTGESTMTGGRVRRALPYVGNETFCLTYGDGVADVNISALLEFHAQHGRQVTMTAVQPPGRFGAFTLREESRIRSFREKPKGDGSWINGGFFVVEPQAVEQITSDATVWEQEPLEILAEQGELMAFKHAGFWLPMDTLRDKHVLEDLWTSGHPPWKIW